jgi:hypothetical protein
MESHLAWLAADRKPPIAPMRSNLMLDLDLVREILLRAENSGDDPRRLNLSIEGYARSTVAEHLNVLERLNYLLAARGWRLRGRILKSLRLTLKGSDFLDRSRDADQWSQVKDTLANQIGTELLYRNFEDLSRE